MADEPEGGRPFSLDDIDDETLLARLKKIPGLADLFTDPVSGPLSAKAQHYAPPKDDATMTDKIVAALEKLGERGAPAAQQPLTSAEPVKEVVQVAKSWFLDE